MSVQFIEMLTLLLQLFSQLKLYGRSAMEVECRSS
jgi:hypothetical protein